MQLPGLITVQPEQTALLKRLAHMMGISFMEEFWTRTWLDALDDAGVSAERKLAINQAIILNDLTIGSPHACCYALEDEAACACGYLRSDLRDITWSALEDESFVRTCRTALSPNEVRILEQQAERMKPISNFHWEEQAAADEGAQDFIHFVMLGVDKNRRGSGAFRRLMDPFFKYADEQDIPCFLETYSDNLEALYTHVGFETLQVFSDPAFPVTERCMIRRPR